MKIKQLVSYWDQHAQGRLAAEPYIASLSEEHVRQLQQLASLYPMKTAGELLRDMVSASLDELETSFPYVQGEKVVAHDEDGFEIYEDVGMTPKFIEYSQRHMERLKNQQLESVA